MELKLIKTACEDVSASTNSLPPEDLIWICSICEILEDLNLDDSEVSVVYYVAGCIGRSIGRTKKCDE